MVEKGELPIKESLPPSVAEIEYRHAYNRLREFVYDLSYKNLSTFEKLSIETSSIGEDLSLVLRGGGNVIKEIITDLTGNENFESFEYWRWVINGHIGKGIISAELMPESNSIYIIRSYTGRFDYGYFIEVPIKTHEYSIDVGREDCPSLALMQGDETFRPQKGRNDSRDTNLKYAYFLHEAVTDLLSVVSKTH